jgi:hypothetical protein
MTISSYPAYVNISPTGNVVRFGGTTLDAFGRLQVSSPFTLFDSQNRYQLNNKFDSSTATGGTVTYLPNESSVALAVTTTSGSEVIRQSYRSFPYQPGKSLLVLNTFVFAAAKTGLRQRVGYFSTQNGVFLELNNSALNLVKRTYTSGSVVDTVVPQSSWNVDKFDGTGESGITLDMTKTQIFWEDFEWLGVGSVRCGFVIDGVNYICHQFNHANVETAVYMTTAILPVRYEITNTSTTASVSTMKQICSTVISEGGYEKKVALNVARRTTAATGITTSFYPLVSIQLASGRTGAVIIPDGFSVLPTTTGDFEIAIIKNAALTGASFTTSTTTNVDYDVTATALTGGTIIKTEFVSSTNQSSAAGGGLSDYNFDLQLGATIAGVSDVYTLAIRSIAGTNSAIGSLSFYDLT